MEKMKEEKKNNKITRNESEVLRFYEMNREEICITFVLISQKLTVALKIVIFRYIGIKPTERIFLTFSIWLRDTRNRQARIRFTIRIISRDISRGWIVYVINTRKAQGSITDTAFARSLKSQLI